MVSNLLYHAYRYKHLLFVCTIAFILRALVFHGYIQHDERHRQPDSVDYHVAAVGITQHIGMHRLDTGKPIFWRTPGYPLYLALFYKLYGITSPLFKHNSQAQKASIWLQILLCSLLPALIYMLALILTASPSVALFSASISAVHVGLVLASTYILTDALATIAFILFLILFYRSLLRPSYTALLLLISSALMLGVFTWIRPLGQVLFCVAALTLIFFRPLSAKKRLLFLTTFTLVFFASISPWYVRNYKLTGHWFFCPLLGPYLTVFSAPKIKARVDKLDLATCHTVLSRAGGQAAADDIKQAHITGSPYTVCTELSSLRAALPWIKAYPLYFMYDWLVEVTKTALDLYSSQLVSFAAQTHTKDPLVEYLPDKYRAALYKQPMPLVMRIICWLELLFCLALWLGLILSSCIIITQVIQQKLWRVAYYQQKLILLVSILLFIAVTIGLTGGFGYARLRLPVEPLIIILGCSSWVLLYNFYSLKQKIRLKAPIVT